MAAGADQHEEVEQAQVEEEDGVEQHCQDAEDEDHFEGPPADPDEPLLNRLVQHLVGSALLPLGWPALPPLDEGPRRALDDEVVQLEDVEVDGEDEEPEEEFLEGLPLCDVLAVECEVAEDVEGDDGVEAADGLADGDGGEGLVLEVVEDLVDAEVGGVGADVGGDLHLDLVLQVLLGLPQLLLVLLEQFQHGGVVEDGREVHHAGDYVEDDAPAVGEVALPVGDDEVLLENEDEGEKQQPEQPHLQGGLHRPPEEPDALVYKVYLLLLGRLA